jgi:murein DD-endopeptidase MepM/ murein hydrolase activator NlpD
MPVKRQSTAAPVAPSQAAVPLPVDAPLTSHFGWRADPLDGRVRFHRGVDVRAAYGTEVPAAAQGTVVVAGEQGGYGTTVVVEHPHGLRTRYAHLSASLVRVGDEVTVGQPVGRVGSSGRSTGAHLHFEVEQGGRGIDPEVAAARFAALDGFKARAGSADSPTGGDPLLATEE